MMRVISSMVLIFLGTLSWIQPVRADWTNLGIYGGTIFDIAVDPQNPSKLFAGAYLGGGLFVSNDGGGNWYVVRMEHRIEGEDTFEGQAVYDVDVASGNSDVVWATHNYWAAHSGDGGLSWHHIYIRTMQADCAGCGGFEDSYRLCRALAIDPSNADIVYVGTGGPMGSDAHGAVYKTEDGGQTWTKLNQGVDLDFRVEDVAVDPRDPRIIWAVTNANGYGGVWDGTVYRSTDSGQTFEPITPKPVTGIITSVAPKPDDANVVFVTGTYGVIRLAYDNNQSQWIATYPISNCWYGTDIRFAPSDPETVYAVWYLGQGWGPDPGPKVSRSTDGGVTWETVTLGGDIAYYLNAVAVVPDDPASVYIGDNALGILHSVDQGLSWAPVNQGLDAVVVYDVDVDGNDTRHMIAASGTGLFERPAGTEAWLRKYLGDFRSVRFEPGSSSTYYAGAVGTLIRTPDNGATWQFTTGLPGKISDIAVDPTDTAVVFVASGQQVLHSEDSGTTFSPVLNGINQAGESYAMNTLTIDPSNPRHILAGGGDFYLPGTLGDLWESDDGGSGWHRTGLTDVIVNAVLIDPRSPLIMYAGCGYSSNYTPPFYKSVDGGATWSERSDGMPNREIPLEDTWASSTDNVLAVGMYGTILRYNGSAVVSMESGTENKLYGVFGLSADQVWAVGANGTILHYDGNHWSSMTSGVGVTLSGVWAAAPDQVIAVGEGGTILHYDGSSWIQKSGGTTAYLNAVFGTPGGMVAAVGEAGTLLHYDAAGGTWSEQASPTDQNLYSVWGLADGTLYAVGNAGIVLHYDGSQWTILYAGNADDRFSGVWGTSPSDLYVAAGFRGMVLHFDGVDWRETYSPTGRFTTGVCGTAPDAVFVIDEDGGFSLFDGARWSGLRAAGTIYRSVTDLAFHRADPNIVYAATRKAGVYISPNQAGNWLNFGPPPSEVYAISSGSLYAATGAGAYQLTGTGVLAGRVRDVNSTSPIDGAMVATDLGNHCRSIMGDYMMVMPAGVFDAFALADNYQTATVTGLTIRGSDVTWQNFEMLPGESVNPGSIPLNNASTTYGNTNGGSYCFVGTLAGDVQMNRPIGILLVALAVTVWSAISGRSRILFFLAVLAALHQTLLPVEASAGTIFQQVGIASPPVPVGSGARAMGMGGAFIATADDATAASWNPAGLIQLEKPEVSIVGGYALRSMDFESNSHPESNTSGDDSHTSLNYFSATFPLHWLKNMVLSVNYQQLYDFERSFSYPFNYTQIDRDEYRTYEQKGQLGAVGLAGAIELTPHVSVGGTLNIWTDKLGWDNGWREDFQSHATGTISGTPTTIDTDIQDQYEKFRGINLNLGVLWETNGWGRFGAVIKTPFTASMVHHFRLTQTTVSGSSLPSKTISTVDEEIKLAMPFSYGVGWSRRFTDSLTIGLDLSRTHWDNYTLTDGQGNEFSPIDGRPKDQSQVEPTTHVRIGAEYVLMLQDQQTAIPVRAGLFYDPEPGQDGSKDFYGLSLGGGVTRKAFSLDLAYQLRRGQGIDTGNLIAGSEADIIQQTILASLIYYF